RPPANDCCHVTRRLVESFRFVLLDDLVQGFDGHRKPGRIHHRLSKAGKPIERWPRLRFPETRTDDAFRAVKERLFDLDREHELRCLAVSGHRLTQIQIAHDPGGPAETQRLALPGHEEDEADPWILQDVREGVGSTIPWP